MVAFAILEVEFFLDKKVVGRHRHEGAKHGLEVEPSRGTRGLTAAAGTAAAEAPVPATM